MPETPDLSHIALAILAGGQSRRMGIAKTSLQIDGRPILKYLLQQMSWPGPKLLVSAPSRRNPPGRELFDSEVVDAVEGEGPLRGVLTALLQCTTEMIIICTVDMPAVGLAQLRWIVQELADADQLDGLMPRRWVDGQDQIEPFPLACRKSAEGAVEKQLGIKRSVHALLELPRFAVKDAPRDWPASVWTNLNSPEDFEAFLASRRPG